MGKLIQLKTDSESLLIESTISEKTGKFEQAGGIEQKIGTKLSDLLKVIHPLTDSIVNSVNDISKKPDSISAEFGLSITAEGNIFVAKATGEASLKITFTWGK